MGKNLKTINQELCNQDRCDQEPCDLELCTSTNYTNVLKLPFFLLVLKSLPLYKRPRLGYTVLLGGGYGGGHWDNDAGDQARQEAAG